MHATYKRWRSVGESYDGFSALRFAISEIVEPGHVKRRKDMAAVLCLSRSGEAVRRLRRAGEGPLRKMPRASTWRRRPTTRYVAWSPAPNKGNRMLEATRNFLEVPHPARDARRPLPAGRGKEDEPTPARGVTNGCWFFYDRRGHPLLARGRASAER